MDYSAFTVRDLRELAQSKLGVASAALKTKAELISALKALEIPTPLGPLDPSAMRPSAPLPPPSPGFRLLEPRVVDHDFFVEAGRPRPAMGADEDRVFAFNQDPEVIAISWHLTEKTVAEGARLFLVGAGGMEQAYAEPLTTATGFAVIRSGVDGPAAYAQVRNVQSGAVLAKSGTVSVPTRSGEVETSEVAGVVRAPASMSTSDVLHPSSW